MRKLVLASALVLGGLSTYAAPSVVFHDGIMDVVFQEEYTEIAASDLPDAVKAALEKDFAGATLDKAYVNDNNEYKLEITVDEMTKTLYADADGNWIDK